MYEQNNLNNYTAKEGWIAESPRRNCVEKECPEIREGKKVLLSFKVFQQIASLCGEYKDLEWMGGLVGKEEEECYKVEELLLFEQEVNGSHVELTDEGTCQMAKTKGLIGWIHSHNTMSVFLSMTDVETAGWNKLSIVVNNKLEMVAKSTKTLSCGKKALVECDIEIPKTFKDKKLIKLAKKLIKEKKYNTTEWDITDEKKDKETIQCDWCGMVMDMEEFKEGNFFETAGMLFHKDCVQMALQSGLIDPKDLYYDGYSHEEIEKIMYGEV